jgi:hypothetical protein
MGDGTPVDDIAQDDQKLEEKATELVRDPDPVGLIILLNAIQCGEDVTLDVNWTVGKDLESVDSTVRAILVKIHDGGGAVRVYSSPLQNVVTGGGSGFVIVAIKSTESCRLFGSPSVRYFRGRVS